MRISVRPADDGACGAYRTRWVAEHLAAEGHDIIVGDSLPIRVRTRKPDHLPEMVSGESPKPWHVIVGASVDADVLVLQRESHRKWLDIIPMLQAQGVRVVMDIDDNYDCLHRDNVVWHAVEPHWLDDVELADWRRGEVPIRVARRVERTGPKGRKLAWSYCPDVPGEENRAHLRTIVGLVDELIVSTPALAGHYGRFARKTTVVRNHVPAGWLDIGRAHREGDVLRVGWTGTVGVHPRDLQALGNGLANVRAPHAFVVIGDGNGVEEATGRPVDAATGWVPLADYPLAYAQCDLALCPLAPTKFNRGKSWNKPLEAAALGVIPIMSPLPEYLALHALGVGLIARNGHEWTRHLEVLLASPLERHRLRTRGLEVASALTIEGNAHRWLDAWTGAHAPQAVDA